jgi:flagellar basal-body rod modification protein FlgD
MSQLPIVQNNSSSSTSSTGSTGSSTSANASINDLDVNSFLKIMIAELQHQDPLNPMDSSQMLDQIGQMRQITASDKLTSTLNSVLLGQNIASSTNLIGAEITGISDDSQKVSGKVTSVAIDKGVPKLQVDLSPTGVASPETGKLDGGKYSYKIVWQDGDALRGIEFSGDHSIATTNGTNTYHAVELDNLPETAAKKQIYRTDKTGSGDYHLVGTLTDGSQSSFLDTMADGDRSPTVLTEPFKAPLDMFRHFIVSLSNVGEIMPPSSS